MKQEYAGDNQKEVQEIYSHSEFVCSVWKQEMGIYWRGLLHTGNTSIIFQPQMF